MLMILTSLVAKCQLRGFSGSMRTLRDLLVSKQLAVLESSEVSVVAWLRLVVNRMDTSNVAFSKILGLFQLRNGWLLINDDISLIVILLSTYIIYRCE